MKPSEIMGEAAALLRGQGDHSGLYSQEEVAAMLERLAAYSTADAMVILELCAERRRQIEVEKFLPEDDDRYVKGELALAAAAYSVRASFNLDPVARLGEIAARLWPWPWHWWKPKDRRRDLIRAGALIIAEIERLDRATASPELKP